MPDRKLLEKINESKGLSEATPFTQDLYKRLIVFADDYGRAQFDLEVLRAKLYVHETNSVSKIDLFYAAVELSGIGKIVGYTSNTGKGLYVMFPRWDNHQRLRVKNGRYPEPVSMDFNDWLRSLYIPLYEKAAIFVNNKFSCNRCGRSYALDNISTQRAVRILADVLRVDIFNPVDGRRKLPVCDSCLTMDAMRLSTDVVVSKFNEWSKIPKDPDTIPFALSSTVALKLAAEKETVQGTLIDDPIIRTKKNKNDSFTVPVEKIVDLYHSICTSLPRVMKVTDARKKTIISRWKEHEKSGKALDAFRDVFTRVQASAFHTGQNDSGWKAHFDWIINVNNWVKIIERFPKTTKRVSVADKQTIAKAEECYKNNRGNCHAFRTGSAKNATCAWCMDKYKGRPSAKY